MRTHDIGDSLRYNPINQPFVSLQTNGKVYANFFVAIFFANHAKDRILCARSIYSLVAFIRMTLWLIQHCKIRNIPETPK